ncbi:MAG TPA: alpha/beta hydrolase [Parvularcula sp.]|nr:alpha/beta hydrolase [Parvularcula sp.]HBS36558.1 alpha/beta hydrolase [Parvularcula sp.]
MTSLRAQLANRYLRLTLKKKALHQIEPAELRAYFEARRIGIHPRTVSVEAVDHGGVRGEWQRPANAEGGRILLYIHGGGYVFGSTGLYRSMTMPMAQFAGADLFALDYRLAPEHPCPAAIEDALAAYEWLLRAGHAPDLIAIGGDSAGGGLALAALQALRERGRPMPACAFVYSPWADLAATGASMTANAARDCMFQEASIREGAKRYAGALALDDPRVSPLYGDFRGLPPLLILASEDEMLFDDARRVAEKARGEGVDVRFEPRGGLCHVWPLFHPLYPEAKEALALTGDFVRARTSAARKAAA